MRLAIISVTENGSRISEKLLTVLTKRHTVDWFSFKKYPSEKSIAYSKLQQLVDDVFYLYDGLIFVCAVGIAVRKIAPHLSSKLTDPAVVAVDEMGKFAVPVVSGHLGGANALARFISDNIGADVVITTATDIGGKFSPDSFAAANNLHICCMNMAKELAAAVLRGEKIGLFSEFSCKNIPDFFIENAEYGICISENGREKPFSHTLNLIPKRVSVGIGCKKDTDSEKLENFVLEVLEKSGISISNIRFAATIDLKRNERSILRFCRKYTIPLRFYTAEQLMNVKGEFISSEFVKSVTGVDNVCERSAAVEGGKIIVPKYSENGMTFSVAENSVDIDFERRII